MSTKRKVKHSRLKTGIPGLDSMLDGGYIPERNILVSGHAGSGKSTFGFQFIDYGVQHGEPSLYITLEESRKKLHIDMLNFGIDIEKLEKTGKFFFIGGPIAELTTYMRRYDAKTEHILMELEEVIKQKKIKRVVVDSINLFTMLADNDQHMRESFAALCNTLSSLGCVSLLISEISEGVYAMSKTGIEEFVVDGVISIYRYKEGSKYIPGITIWKMRGTKHETQPRPFRFTEKGIVVYPNDSLFINK